MNSQNVLRYGKWLAGLLLIVWFVGRYQGTWFGDPVLDHFLAKHDGDVVAALIEAERPRLDAQGAIIGIHLARSINRHRLPNLRYSNKALEYIKQIRTIRSLTIVPPTHIDDRGMAHIGEMTQLESLGINGLPITDAGLAQLHSLKNLQLLRAYVTNCTQDGINDFQAAVPACEIQWGPRN